MKIRPQFHRPEIELVGVEPPLSVAWCFIYPDAAHSSPVLAEFTLNGTDGGTKVTITTSWMRRRGWRRIVSVPVRPLQKLMVWLSLFQTGSAISRAFR